VILLTDYCIAALEALFTRAAPNTSVTPAKAGIQYFCAPQLMLLA